MGIQFPDGLKHVWLVSNGLELPGGWYLFSVFDRNNVKKTTSHIKYENTRVRWSYMDESLITIARGDTGNCLVLRNVDGLLDDVILFWNHETNKTRKWGKGFDYIIEKAEARVAKIEAQIAKSRRKQTRKA